MKWMTKAQRETFLVIAELSPGKSRPWIAAEQVLEKRLNGQKATSHQRGAKLDWIKAYLRQWSSPGAFVETRAGKMGRVWRLTRRGKALAKTGKLP